jgi:hypothetical protein
VRVRTNYAKAARRWIGWGAAAVVGGLLAKFGEGTFDAIGRMLAGLAFNRNTRHGRHGHDGGVCARERAN